MHLSIHPSIYLYLSEKCLKSPRFRNLSIVYRCLSS
jgi:hypothetical protein